VICLKNRDQLADLVISVFLKEKELNRKPLFQDFAFLNSSAKVYLSYWDALFLRDGILYKKWQSLNSEILQVVSCNRINQILVAPHYSLSRRHFSRNYVFTWNQKNKNNFLTPSV